MFVGILYRNARRKLSPPRAVKVAISDLQSLSDAWCGFADELLFAVELVNV
jgi:hypothetical protein